MLSTARQRSKSGHDRRTGPRVATAEHILQLFDTDESLSASVASFLRDGAAEGQSLLVVATKRHWAAIASDLGKLGVDVTRLRRGRRLTVGDAEELLSRFMRQGEPNGSLFAQTVGQIVTGLASAAPRGLRIYGEMVEVLAQEGNYRAAAQLEILWNDLGRRCPFQLLCGYSAAHFAAPDAGAALSAICHQHSQCLTQPSDTLGRFLLEFERRRGPSSTAAR